MTKHVLVFGPPGTGKTRALTAIFVGAANQYAPDRVAFVSYTRAAAGELMNRIGTALNLSSNPKVRARQVPWAGTIHSLAYKLCGAPEMVDGRDGHFREFCEGVHINAPEQYGDANTIEGFWWTDVVDTEEASIFRRALSTARHRMISLREALDELPQERMTAPVGRYLFLEQKYTEWKRDTGYMDYEDLLDRGCELRPPVKALLVDEAQDCSKLIFRVLDAWAESTEYTVMAGDPGQSIFSWAGAAPELFANCEGEWQMMRTSHRFSAESADYAKKVIALGWDDPRFQQWTGEGGEPVDGSIFYLARTHALLGEIRRDLLDNGEPFLELRGTAPWATKAAKSYRVLTQLLRGDEVSLGQVYEAAKTAGLRNLHTIDKNDVDRTVGMEGAAYWITDVEGARSRLKYADYFRQIDRKYGIAGFVVPPKISLGTCHASKGLEADVVNLITSWATLPAQSLGTRKGMRDEASVAYVGASRHRVKLNLLAGYEGTAFPFPGGRD